MPTDHKILSHGAPEVTSTVSPSSEVERKTASSVPARISPLSYSLAHITEKPHCGITPAAAPTAGANFPESARFSRPFVSSRSRSSIKT